MTSYNIISCMQGESLGTMQATIQSLLVTPVSFLVTSVSFLVTPVS